MKQPKSGGGFPAILYTVKKSFESGSFLQMWKGLRSKNACKTCALGMGGQKGGMVNEEGRFPEVCKKSIQAMSADLGGLIKEDFWEKHTHDQLQALSSRELEGLGRLGHPLFSSRMDSQYRTHSWEEALSRISEKLKKTDPKKTFFYFSGRSSNEAAFLLQLFARLYGTNNVNNCSYYCHQASGVGLKNVIGSGTATLRLEDLEYCDTLFLIGGNPASNHPRFMTTLMKLKRRGGRIVVINPIKEIGLVNFKIPSDIRSLLWGTKIADCYLQPKIGGDISVMIGIAKIIIDRNKHDLRFLEQLCIGFNEWRDQVKEISWSSIEETSGLSQDAITEAADIYAESKKAVFSWTMGITHHAHGVENVEMIAALALIRGMVGKLGSGLLPLRGHSNVQGIGSVGATPVLNQKTLRNLEDMYEVNFPKTRGLDTMACMESADRGEIELAICLGGNLFGSNPDTLFASRALSKIDLVTYISTTLNKGHVLGRGRETLVLPVFARDEELQGTTQESMFNFVRFSSGGVPRYSGLKSEVDLISSLGQRVLKQGPVDWSLMKDHKKIREIISSCVPGYSLLNNIDLTKKEFTIAGRIIQDNIFPTSSGKACFQKIKIPIFEKEDEQLVLMTIRSEGQFNTVVYEEHDYYRGQSHRNVILLNEEDMKNKGLTKGSTVRVSSSTGELSGIEVAPCNISRGCAAMYYPEANVLVSRLVDERSRTPAFKRVLVDIYVE